MRNPDDFILLQNGQKSNFKHKEFTFSATALRHGIVNQPTEEQWINIEFLTHYVLQPIREKFGRLRITSGFRCPELCEKVGSNATSNHTKGEAADIEPLSRRGDLITVLKYIHRKLPYRELIAEYFPEGWIHVAYRRNGNTSTVKLKDANHNYERVTLDYILERYEK